MCQVSRVKGDDATCFGCLPGQGFVSEDEYLEITGITREQSGEYECSAVNDVAVPDVRKVKVTVNCECPGRGSGGGAGAEPGVTLRGVSTDPPYISNAKNTGASVGQKGILQCEASAVPVAEFQWFKEDTRSGGAEPEAGRVGDNHASPVAGGLAGDDRGGRMGSARFGGSERLAEGVPGSFLLEMVAVAPGR